MKIINRTIVISLSILLFGCVSTPKPNPVSVKQEGDKEVICEYLKAEYKANTEAATRKIANNNSADMQDLIIGILVWPGLADFNNAPGHEGNALLDRNAWLKNIGEVKKCDILDWPMQPSRY